MSMYMFDENDPSPFCIVREYMEPHETIGFFDVFILHTNCPTFFLQSTRIETYYLWNVRCVW